MATDVDVQFFSHLNGLVLGNNWGDMIRLLDTCLVNGLPLPSVTSASVDSQGDITLNLYADHKSLLFQIVELSGFEPVEINGKYRIKGTPTTIKLILKATHVGKTVTKIGTAKLTSLGYDVVFRDSADIKRVYRAKNPRAEHPFTRVDETISDGTNSYTSTYAKSAMVGLIENMTHIDDYQDTSKLQLPLDNTDFTKNWKISGTGTSVVRGWSRWYWSRAGDVTNNAQDVSTPNNNNRSFTLLGDLDAFYIVRNIGLNSSLKSIIGCGLFNSALKNDVIPNWFLATALQANTAGTSINLTNSLDGSVPLALNVNASKVFTCAFNEKSRISSSIACDLITPDYQSGFSDIYSSNNVAALEIPLKDSNKYLRGTLKYLYYNGKNLNIASTACYFADNSMYVAEAFYANSASSIGSPIFYLGELE